MKGEIRELNFAEHIALEILWGGCRLFGMLPNFVHYYIIAPIIYFIVYKLIRYRVAVVDENLSHAFAERTPEERLEIRRGFYVTLSEIFVSTIAMASPRYKGKFDAKDDLTCEAAELRERVRGTNWIALTAHIGLWEQFLLWGDFSEQFVVGAYHKLRNPIMDRLFLRLRTRHHHYAVAVERKSVARFCIKHRTGVDGKNFVLGLLADQNAAKYADSKWIEFLGRETIFFDGGETLALKLGFPVYFVYLKRVGRGDYRFAFKPIYDGVESVEPYEITRRYVTLLEEEIRLHPELWLWSHRRWKNKRD